MKIVQKGNKQLKVADERLDEMLGRGFTEVDQKTGKLITKKDPKTDKIATLEKENAELKKLTEQNRTVYSEYKEMQADLMMLRQIKCDVDKVMRELYPERMQTDKTKETETTL